MGQFDGNKFTPVDTKNRWLDYGPDEYAGITWGNTGSRKIFLGWMSNWEYANQVPTEKWRNAMTIPRDLVLKKVNGELLLASVPVGELKNIAASAQGTAGGKLPAQSMLKANIASINDYAITLSNSLGEELVIGYDKKANQYYIDRTKAGKVDFQKDFKGRFVAPRFATTKTSDLTLVIDGTSVELFADKGLTTMTTIFFPNKPFDRIAVKGIALKQTALKSIWK